MFALLYEWETPLLPPEQQNTGAVGWVIEYAALTNSLDDHAPILYCLVRPRKVIFKQNAKRERSGRWTTYAESIGGPYFGWWASTERFIFASAPTWWDQVRYVKLECKQWHEGLEIRPW